MASITQANVQTPSPAATFAHAQPGFSYVAGNPNTTLAGSAIASAGGDQPHNNLMPYLTLNFCIAMQGVYPPRT
jgi:microcystin-dependent protein